MWCGVVGRRCMERLPVGSVNVLSKGVVARRRYIHHDCCSPGYDSLALDPRRDWRQRAVSRSNLTVKDPAKLQSYPRQIRTPPPSTRVNLGEPFYDAIRAYEDRFLPLITAEQEETETIFRARLSSWSLNRLREEGYTITGLSAFWLEDQHVAVFTLGAGVKLPEHRFVTGSPVLLSVIDPLREVPQKGSVVAHSAYNIKICFSDHFGLGDGGQTWRLDVDHSQAVYLRMREAIAHLHHDLNDPARTTYTSDSQLILQGTLLRDILLRTFSLNETHAHKPLQDADAVDYVSEQTLEHGVAVQSDNMGIFMQDRLIQSWARRYSKDDPVQVEGDPRLDGLNPVQIKAMAMMIGKRISLVQGPPGTGKTKTIIETLKLLKAHFQVPQKILVCTFTNVAVDNLVEGCAKAGLKAVRVAHGGKVRPDLAEYALEHLLANHALTPAILRQESQAQDCLTILQSRKKSLSDAMSTGDISLASKMEREVAKLEGRLKVLSKRLYASQQTRLRAVLDRADVVCTTCITSASRALQVFDFPIVFLDEASMCAEPASLVPLMKGCEQLSLIGDHKQLPPVISSRHAQSQGLGISLFERLTEEGDVPTIMLNIQYRMHPQISKFPAVEFYDRTLYDGVTSSILSPPTSRHLKERENGQRPSVIFLDHTGNESIKDRSRVNYNEAHIVASVVEDLLLHNKDLTGKDIGIIAPYAAQISLLKRTFAGDKSGRLQSVLGDYRAMQVADIEIQTVDGFEGREKDVIIFSTVRNNSAGYIGFLADRRRLNVGLTRAKRGLFVVGSISTLQAGRTAQESGLVYTGKGGDSWKRYTKFLKDHGLVVTLNGLELHRALYGNHKSAERAKAAI